jgi:CRP-like cAMP-binding protein
MVPSALESLATTVRYRRHQEIYNQDGPVNYRYRLVSGAALRFATLPVGRRQIVDFLLPGDYFGLTSRREHSFTVEAITADTLVARYPCARIEALIALNPDLSRWICELTAAEISRLQARILLLGRITAQEKINAFLLEMTERLSDGRDKIDLPMSRYDVADYLAISVETVSRTLTVMKQRGTIRLAGTRCVQLVDRDALEDGADPHDRLTA